MQVPMTGLELQPWELVCYCFIFLVGLVGNLIICLVVLKSGPSYRCVTFNIYLMALAVADLTLAVVCLPIYIMSTSSFPHPTGTQGTAVCKIVTGYLLTFWLGGVSIYLLVVISFERYAAISRPLQAMARSTSKRTASFIAFAWVIAFVIQIPTVVGVNFSTTNATIGNYCTYIWKDNTATVIYAFVFAFQYVIPAVIFIINFYRIKISLAKLDKSLGHSFRNLEAQQLAKVMRRKAKTVRIVFVASVAFFISWTANNIMYFLFQYGGMKDISWNSNVYQAGVLLGFLNSCINPFLYAFQSKEFRFHCKAILVRVFRMRTVSRRTAGICTPGSLCEGASSSSSTGGKPKLKLYKPLF